jgi:hypothetical protein
MRTSCAFIPTQILNGKRRRIGRDILEERNPLCDPAGDKSDDDTNTLIEDPIWIPKVVKFIIP